MGYPRSKRQQAAWDRRPDTAPPEVRQLLDHYQTRRGPLKMSSDPADLPWLRVVTPLGNGQFGTFNCTVAWLEIQVARIEAERQAEIDNNVGSGI